MRSTPFTGIHRQNGGKMVDFVGWEMPVHFPPGIVAEHLAVRKAAGLFDVAHMGRLHFRGPGAVRFVNHLITNDLEKIAVGQLLYSALCQEDGGVVDDVTVYHMGDWVLMVVNAANADKVEGWVRSRLPNDVEFSVQTPALAQVALQGPQAEPLLREPFSDAVRDLGYYHFTRFSWRGVEVLISRNGYTGEDGFEIYIPNSQAAALWETLMDWGRAVSLQPIGLGARDSLRMEVNYALYGNELGPDITPLEAGLRWVVKFKKEDFVGKAALVRQKDEGLARTIVGFEVAGRRLPRHGQPILSGDRTVGVVTSGGYCPSLDKGMGMGFVPPDLSGIGTAFDIDARGTRLSAVVVERPFYKNGSVKR